MKRATNYLDFVKRIVVCKLSCTSWQTHSRQRPDWFAGADKQRVARLMRARGLQAVCIRTATRQRPGSNRQALPAPDLVGRDFVPDAPNQI